MLTVEVEPNGSMATATVLPVNESLVGNVVSSGDVDFFKVMLNQGQRFSLSTINSTDFYTAPTLPAQFDLFEGNGTLVESSIDFIDDDLGSLRYVAPKTGDYFVRVSSNTRFGTYVDPYSVQTKVTNFAGVSEQEPNNTIAAATLLASGQQFLGSVAIADAVDLYAIALNANDVVAVDFSGTPTNSPGVRLLTSAGGVVASSLDGLGLVSTVSVAGNYYIEIGRNTTGSFVGQYVGVVIAGASGVAAPENGNGFDANSKWTLDFGSFNYVAGTLGSLDDFDVYQFSTTNLNRWNFSLGIGSSDSISKLGRTLILSNSFGQPIVFSQTGSLSLSDSDALTAGTYYLSVGASSLSGLGAYMLQSYSSEDLSEQRDVTLHFVDFNQQMPTHMDYPWVSSYAVPTAEPFVVGMFESRYDIYDMDVTLQKPSDGTEFISSGYGNFGDIGAGGYGDRKLGIGQRKTRGDTVTSATELAWNTITYGSTETLIHEFGHAMGMPHARSATAFLGYVNETEYIPIGSRFTFLRDDSRRPGELLANDRNYLDRRSQPGSQAMEKEPNSSAAQALDPNLLEMSFEFSTLPDFATGDSPIQTLSGDFNADGKADAAVVSADSNDLRIYLNDGTGKLTLKVTQVLDDLNWWEEPMAIGDFNRDGRSDVAVMSRNNNRIALFLAAADGSLGAPTYIATGSLPNSLVASDINRDGILDLIAGTSTRQIAVHIGSSNGSFSTGSLFNIGINPWSMTLADFNGDGSIDLAAAGNATNVGIVYGDGTGRFGSLQTLTGTVFYRGITSGDFNGDQKPDIASVGRGAIGTTVFLRQGSTFAAGVTYEAMYAGEMINSTDVNRDGILDLVVGGFSDSFAASLLGNGDGTFGQAIDFEGGAAPTSAAVADFNGDAINDLLFTSYSNDTLRVFLLKPNNPRNDRVTVYGDIASSSDVDRYSIRVQPGDVYTFDIDSAEFQYPLDARMRILSSSGTVLATSSSALDRDSGLDSTDPYIKLAFNAADTITIEVTDEHTTVGNYRLKVTPKRAYEIDGTRVIASLPDNGAILDNTNQLVFFTDGQIDPSSLTKTSLLVRGASNGIQTGTARFNPLDSTIVWTAANVLPSDSYSVTLSGGVNGLTDLQGTPLDGEIASNFAFPLVSGDGNPGGDYVLRFTINATDASPAVVTRAIYERDPNQRGQFTLEFSDQLSFDSVLHSDFIARGAGLDQAFGTSDDHILPLDAIYDKIYNAYSQSRLVLYTRGIPDPDQYRIEGLVRDAANFRIDIQQRINVGVTVPNSALFQDAALSQPGIVGSYVNRSLRTSTAQADWRTTQTISGSRVDSTISFIGNKAGFDDRSFGSRSQVGVTGGTDLNWDNFSAQWDGWISIPADGIRMQTRSDEGSRMWIDVNNDGTFASDSSEFIDNGFGLRHLIGTGALSSPLTKGNYRIRVQYEEGTGSNAMVLEWVTPDRSGEEDGLGHGPTVIGLNVIPNATTNSNTLDRLEVTFSAALDATSLTTQNFGLRYSADPNFFDGNDVRIQDADNSITWNAITHTATLVSSTPFPSGYYLIELNGSQGGIKAPNGSLLDGEFVNNRIVGNTTAPGWSETPSGNGIAGGDYRAFFTLSSSPAILEISPTSISESGGTATVTVKRSDASDTSTSQIVILRSSDTTEAIVPDSVTIPVGSLSTTFTVTAVNDSLVDGNQLATISAMIVGVFGIVQVFVVDDDIATLTVSLTSGSISENAGTTTGTVTRNTSTTSALIVNLTSSDTTAATVPSTVTIPAGSTSVTFTVTAINDSIADGSQVSTITASATGLVSGTAQVTVVDDETATLLLVLASGSISENAGTTTGTVTRNTPTTSALIVNLTSSDTTAATVPSTVTIPAGSTSTTFTLTAINDSIADGSQVATITASADGLVSGTAQVTVIDDETATLLLVLASGSISENAGTTTGTVTRNTSTTSALIVNLTSSDTTAATVPSTVTIPAGSTSVTFTVTAINDSIADGSQVSTITASATGLVSGTAQVTVVDDETATLLLVLASGSISENAGTTTGTVTRNTPTTSALIVNLTSSDTTAATVPSTVTIPAGSTSTTFTLTAINDSIVDGSQVATITASADGLVSGTAQVTVIDDETATLLLILASDSISENAGTTTGTVTRNTSTTSSLVVNLTSSDMTAATVPSTVTIPAGSTSATFTVTAINDSIADGSQVSTITASATALVSGTAQVTVVDDETATLLLVLASGSISENAGTTTGTVTRNTPTTSALIVNLTSSDATAATVPSTVTIPAGSTSATFTVTAINDSIADGSQVSTITASATGLVSGTAQVTVVDDETATLLLILASGSISENAGTTTGTVTRNTPTTSALIVNLTSSDATAATVPSTVTIPAGSTSATFTVTAINDSIADGSQVSTITASAIALVSDTAQVTVVDDETATLLLVLASGSISENAGTTTGTVTRNTSTTSSLVVNLTSSDTTAATVPSTVTIPAGSTSTTFTLTAINDSIVDGSQVATITASADGLVSGTAQIAVVDDETQWPWHNDRNPLDVNFDGFVSPIDALLIINFLNSDRSGVLPDPKPGELAPPPYVDVSRDGSVSPIDALLVINHLNTHPNAEGENEVQNSIEQQTFGDIHWLDSLVIEPRKPNRNNPGTRPVGPIGPAHTWPVPQAPVSRARRVGGNK